MTFSLLKIQRKNFPFTFHIKVKSFFLFVCFCENHFDICCSSSQDRNIYNLSFIFHHTMLDLIYNPSAPNIISKNWFKFSFKLVTEYSSFEHCQSCSWQRREGGNTNPVNLFLTKFFSIKNVIWLLIRKSQGYKLYVWNHL